MDRTRDCKAEGMTVRWPLATQWSLQQKSSSLNRRKGARLSGRPEAGGHPEWMKVRSCENTGSCSEAC